MRKRMVASIVIVVMLFGMFPVGTFHSAAAQTYSLNAIKHGDYFILGRYLEEEIVWRHVGSDEYGDVALSFRVLTSKAYNSKGIKPANVSVPDGIAVPQEVDPRGDRVKYGSNLWVNSTLRAWLNSDEDAGAVSYIGASPSDVNVTANAYDGEAGFLSNFTAAERAAMLPTKRAAALNEIDAAIMTAGTQVPGWDNGSGLTDPIRHMVTDTMFLPDAPLLSRIANDSGLDWSVGYWSTGFHRAGITAKALSQAASPQTPRGEYNAVDYWTGTPIGSRWSGTHQMQIRMVGGGHSFKDVNEGVMGVRPAFYLNHDTITVTGGSGTQDDPYTIAAFDDSFGITLKGNNSTKLYSPDKDFLQISAPEATDLEMSYIKVDPDKNISISNEADFNRYEPTNITAHTKGKTSLVVEQNCTVWVMAKETIAGQKRTSFASFTYRNFYERVQILQEGKAEGTEDYLYHNKMAEGIYGVPLNKFKEPYTLISNPAKGYDTVVVSDALPANLADYWTRTDSNPANITLNDIKYYKDNPTVITMQYTKNSSGWWTVNLAFVDESGNPIDMTVSGQEVTGVTLNSFMPASPGGAYFSDFDLSYPLPVGDNLYPYAWQVGGGEKVTPGDDENMSAGFNPYITADDQTVKIYYKQNRVAITERFIVDGTDPAISIKADIVNWVDNGGYYRKLTAPKIDHYVVTGYQINAKNRVNLTYTDDKWNSILRWDQIVEQLTQDTEVTFFFAADINGDGIPDKDQYMINARWVGVKPDGTETDIKAPQYIHTRVGTENTWANTDDTANHSTSGNDVHTIQGESPEEWIFDSSRQDAPAFQTINQSTAEDVCIYFYYNYDSKGTGVPDIEQGVTAKFAVYDGTVLSVQPSWTDVFTNVVEGGTYIRAVPAREGYVAVGWLLDEENISQLRNFTGRNGNQAEIATTKPKHTVTFVYREAAKPVTIQWVGTALSGHKVEFGHVTVTGYVDEQLTLDIDKLRESVSVEDGWERNDADSDVPNKITFSSSPQEYFFRYKEIQNFSYDVRFVTTDGKTLYEEKIPSTTNAAPFDVTARSFPLYVYTGYEVREYDRIYASGTAIAVTLTPSEGAMSVYFYYTPAVADVTVKAVEQGTNKELSTETYFGKPIGQEFSVSAPHLEGWALADNEKITKTVTVASGVNTVTFAYVRPASVFIQCIEQRDGKEEVLRTVPVTKTGEVTPPDLTGDFFDFDGTNPNNSSNPTIIDNADFASGKVIRYFYTSQMMDVQIVAIGDDGTTLSAVTYSDAAPMGKMYTATAPAAPAGYALADEPIKEVYADPNLTGGILIVTFYYHKLAPGEVTVRHYYTDSGTKTILKEYSVQALVGSPYKAQSEYFPGFTISGGAYETTITVDNDPSNNIIEFEYTDVRKTVTVQVEKNGTIQDSFTQTAKVVAGTVYTVFPPYVDGYSLVGYQIGNNPEKTAGLTAINIGAVNDNVIVTLSYVSYVNITVIGKENDTNGNELFRYVERVRYSSNKETVIDAQKDLPKLALWELKSGQEETGKLTPSTHQAVEFFYESKLATITISAVSSGGEVLPGFPITTSAIKGEPFSYEAPYIQGHKLEGDMIKTIDSVIESAVITFVYTPLPTGNVHLILKEDDTHGRIISEDKYDLALGYSMTVTVPGLQAKFYTALSEPKTVTYTGTDIIVEYYYEKDTVRVVKKTYDTSNNNALIATFEMGRYRIGEIARFYAPSKEEYAITDVALKLKRINPPQTSRNARATEYQEVSFYYTPIAGSGKLAVEAMNESGSILLSYNIAGVEGEVFSVAAPAVPGYKLKPGEMMSKVGVVSGKVTFIYQREDGANFADLTVAVKSMSGAVLKDAEVTAKSGGIKIRTNMTDADGRTVLTDLPTGSPAAIYDVVVKLSGYNDGAASVTLTGDKLLEVKLSKPGTGNSSSSSGGGSGITSEQATTGGAVEQTPSAIDDGMLEKTIHVKYINGFGDGTVRPDAFITRAETASVFYRLLRKEISVPRSIGFTDVSSDAWYADAANVLASIGIISGYPDGTLRPSNLITRAEFAVIASKFEEMEKSAASSFKDIDMHWAEDYIKSAYIKGWISGYPSGEFKPNNPITRAEVVVIVNRILDRRIRKEDIPESANIFTDLSKEHWAYANILEAAIEHDYTKNEDGYEIWSVHE